jgi:hypothetical protein
MIAETPASDTFEDTWAADGSDKSRGAPLLSSTPRTDGADQGPCLYLGPAGQRCDRRAIEGGYCARHRPGASALPKPALFTKTLAAIAAVAGLLWPYIADLVREVIRWMHSR